MNKELNVNTLNVRSFRNVLQRKYFNELLNNHRGITFLQETHSVETDKEEWQKDSSMSSDYHRESMKTPQLHSKYLNYYFDEKKALTRMSKALAKMKRIRFEYYTGTINPVMLDKFKWEPFLRKILKSEVDMYLDADDVLSTMQIDHTDQKEKIKFICL